MTIGMLGGCECCGCSTPPVRMMAQVIKRMNLFFQNGGFNRPKYTLGASADLPEYSGYRTRRIDWAWCFDSTNVSATFIETIHRTIFGAYSVRELSTSVDDVAWRIEVDEYGNETRTYNTDLWDVDGNYIGDSPCFQDGAVRYTIPTYDAGDSYLTYNKPGMCNGPVHHFELLVISDTERDQNLYNISNVQIAQRIDTLQDPFTAQDMTNDATNILDALTMTPDTPVSYDVLYGIVPDGVDGSLSADYVSKEFAPVPPDNDEDKFCVAWINDIPWLGAAADPQTSIDTAGGIFRALRFVGITPIEDPLLSPHLPPFTYGTTRAISQMLESLAYMAVGLIPSSAIGNEDAFNGAVALKLIGAPYGAIHGTATTGAPDSPLTGGMSAFARKSLVFGPSTVASVARYPQGYNFDESPWDDLDQRTFCGDADPLALSTDRSTEPDPECDDAGPIDVDETHLIIGPPLSADDWSLLYAACFGFPFCDDPCAP